MRSHNNIPGHLKCLRCRAGMRGTIWKCGCALQLATSAANAIGIVFIVDVLVYVVSALKLSSSL